MSCLLAVHDRFAGDQRAANQSYRPAQPAKKLDVMISTSAPRFLRQTQSHHGCRTPIDALACHVAVADMRQLHARHFAAAQNARRPTPNGPNPSAQRGLRLSLMPLRLSIEIHNEVDSDRKGFTLLVARTTVG